MKRSCAKSSSNPIILYVCTIQMYNSVEKGPMLLAKNRRLVPTSTRHACDRHTSLLRTLYPDVSLVPMLSDIASPCLPQLMADKTPQTLMTLMAVRQTQPPTRH